MGKEKGAGSALRCPQRFKIEDFRSQIVEFFNLKSAI
jgi:hypothetical protein